MVASDRKAARPRGPSKQGLAYEDSTSPDDALRRLAVQQLAAHLEKGVALVARCEQMAATGRGDKLGAIQAAARLMRANAAVAEALANVAQVERRRRSIVERIQPPDPKQAELNSRLQNQKTTAERKLKILKRLNEHIEESVRARMGEEGAHDSMSRLIRGAEEDLAGAKAQLAELDAS